MSPPNSGKSSLLQPMGLMPRRTDMIAPCPAASADELSQPAAGLRLRSWGVYASPEYRRLQPAMTEATRDTVVFDLGGVLIDWDPRHLYRKLFAGNEVAMEHFLSLPSARTNGTVARTPAGPLPKAPAAC